MEVGGQPTSARRQCHSLAFGIVLPWRTPTPTFWRALFSTIWGQWVFKIVEGRMRTNRLVILEPRSLSGFLLRSTIKAEISFCCPWDFLSDIQIEMSRKNPFIYNGVIQICNSFLSANAWSQILWEEEERRVDNYPTFTGLQNFHSLWTIICTKRNRNREKRKILDWRRSSARCHHLPVEKNREQRGILSSGSLNGSIWLHQGWKSNCYVLLIPSDKNEDWKAIISHFYIWKSYTF